MSSLRRKTEECLFVGRHMLASYVGCDARALGDYDGLEQALRRAIPACGARFLNSVRHEFHPGGVTIVCLLSESHASIHTYPERRACFVDLFTCGDRCRAEKFEAVLRAYLKPAGRDVRILKRHMRTEEEEAPAPAPDGTSSWYMEDAAPFERHFYEVSGRRVDDPSRFQKIGIIENPRYGKILLLDGAVQSAQHDEYIYHEALIHPALLLHPRPQRVLILGGAEGASLREALRHRSVAGATMVDIDAKLVRLCRRHLPEWSAGAFEDPRAHLVIADGKDWVAATRQRFDVAVMDLTDPLDLGTGFPLYTRNFLRTLKRRLTPGGLLVVQAGELSRAEFFAHSSIVKTLGGLFGHVRSYVQFVPSFFGQWSFVLASDRPIPARVDERAWDARLAARAPGTRFYGGAVHNAMFTIPRDLVSVIEGSGCVVTEEEGFLAAYHATQTAP